MSAAHVQSELEAHLTHAYAQSELEARLTHELAGIVVRSDGPPKKPAYR